MPWPLAALPCLVAIYICWVFSQSHCCICWVPELKLSYGWPLLSHSSIVWGNHHHKVGWSTNQLPFLSALKSSLLWHVCQWAWSCGEQHKLELCWEPCLPGERRALGCPPKPITAWQLRFSEMDQPTSWWAECQPNRWVWIWAASKAHTYV